MTTTAGRSRLVPLWPPASAPLQPRAGSWVRGSWGYLRKLRPGEAKVMRSARVRPFSAKLKVSVSAGLMLLWQGHVRAGAWKWLPSPHRHPAQHCAGLTVRPLLGVGMLMCPVAKSYFLLPWSQAQGLLQPSLSSHSASFPGTPGMHSGSVLHSGAYADFSSHCLERAALVSEGQLCVHTT